MGKIEIDLPGYAKIISGSKNIEINKVEIDVPIYSRAMGVWPIVEESYWLQITEDKDHTILIKGDKGGLITLARHLLTLAQDEVPLGSHIHYDEDTFLENGSLSIIIDKVIQEESNPSNGSGSSTTMIC